MLAAAVTNEAAYGRLARLAATMPRVPALIR
jgi:hypothetical protein